MATDMDVRQVQDIIGYRFKSSYRLVEALTAAGADEDNYDGNRKLAQLGESVIQTVVLNDAYTAGDTRGSFLSSEWVVYLLTCASRCKCTLESCYQQAKPCGGGETERVRALY